MNGPNQSPWTLAATGSDFQLWQARDFDVTNLNNIALVQAAGYTVATLQITDRTGTLSTGVLTVVVSNDPTMNEWKAHPVTTTLSAAGVTAGIEVEHFAVGVAVTTAQAVRVDLHLFLKRVA